MAGASLGLAAGMLLTPALPRAMWTAHALFFGVMALFAARAGPLQALMSDLVPAAQRGTLMSLSMAVGQAGAGVGGALAGPAYARFGYASNAALAAASALLVGWLVWRWLPEPEIGKGRGGGLENAASLENTKLEEETKLRKKTR